MRKLWRGGVVVAVSMMLAVAGCNKSDNDESESDEEEEDKTEQVDEDEPQEEAKVEATDDAGTEATDQPAVGDKTAVYPKTTATTPTPGPWLTNKHSTYWPRKIRQGLFRK